MKIPSISKGVPIDAKQTVSESFAKILQSQFDYLVEWEPIAYDRVDIEGVHQLRVAFRRMRSALIVFRQAIPRESTDLWSEEMKWAAGMFGPARDMDVFVDEGLGPMDGKIPLEGGLKKLTALAIAKREQGYEQVRATLDDPRYTAFKVGFPVWLADRGWEGANADPKVAKRMQARVSKYAQGVLDKRLKRVLQYGDINALTTEQLHMLRIDGKKMRYATEFFTPLFPGMDDFNTHLKGLQGLLGTLNDITVMQGLLTDLLQGVSDQETILFAGALIGWRARQYEEIKGQLTASWANFLKAGHPWYS